MPGSLQILVYDRQQEVCQDVFAGAVELGRQRDAREVLYSSHREGERARLVIARPDEDTVSRDHALVEPLGSDRVKLTNTSAKVSIRLADGSELKAGQFCERSLPTAMILGRKTVHIQGRVPCASSGPSRASGSRKNRMPTLCGLAEATLSPGSLLASAHFPTQSLQGILQRSAKPNAQMEEVVGWLQTTMEVFQSAASSPDFFRRAAQAVIEIVGLEHGHVLLYNDGEWKTAASCSSPQCGNSAGGRPSRNMLDRVLQERRTFWQAPEELELDSLSSLADVEMVVASPILSGQGEVIGAIYGDCRQDSLVGAPKVTKVEAVLVELLARGVAVGLARMEQERAAMAARVRFEQFFTPQLAQQLAHEPNLLEGRDVEVSILFCDIRGFSRISERLGPEGTVRWVSQVMEALSDCVLRHGGVLVDYIGDELMAMWGAPVAQPDHARLACSAALDMLGLLPALNEHWQPVLQEPFGVGFSINTGTARVGNTGTRHKFKYGPLGRTVALASRIQAATMHLRCPLVVTEYTRARLDETFHACKLCRVRMVKTEQPVDLYELLPESHPQWQDFKTGYEAALQQFTDNNFSAAARGLGNLLDAVQEDGPALVLLQRAVNALVEGPAEGHPIWDLPSK
jgi:adenylate cyclase